MYKIAVVMLKGFIVFLMALVIIPYNQAKKLMKNNK